jgi:hypothetical protein
MATITSAQTGWWGDPTTWVGGVVPDMSIDDAIVAGGHAVVIEPESYIVLVDGQNLTVENGGLLAVVGGLEVFYYGSLYLDGDLIIVPGGYVSLYDDGNADVNSGAAASVDGYLDLAYYSYLNVYGEITVGYEGYLSTSYDGYISVYGGMITVHGYLDLYDYGYMDLDSGTVTIESDGVAYIGGSVHCYYYSSIYIYGELTVESSGYIETVYASEITCDSSGQLTVDGYLLVADDGSCRVYGPVTFSRSAGFDAWYYGYLEVNSGVVDDFGYLAIHYDAFLYVGGEIRVYKDIYISGQMYGGGKIVMFRREGQIKDGDGNNLFKLDHAYGHGKTAIA